MARTWENVGGGQYFVEEGILQGPNIGAIQLSTVSRIDTCEGEVHFGDGGYTKMYTTHAPNTAVRVEIPYRLFLEALKASK